MKLSHQDERATCVRQKLPSVGHRLRDRTGWDRMGWDGHLLCQCPEPVKALFRDMALLQEHTASHQYLQNTLTCLQIEMSLLVPSCQRGAILGKTELRKGRLGL